MKMPRGMKAELKGLSLEASQTVGAYLMMAGQLIDSDPEAAYQHAEAARRRAARLPITREATAEAAYAAGRYEEALVQYKAWRRMTGSDEAIPVMVDCLRALKRYRDALELADEGRKCLTDPAMLVELVIVTAGVRVDMGQPEEALRLLKKEFEQPSVRHPRQARARLAYALADLLATAGDLANAYRGFAMAASLDPENLTAALDRLDEFDGVVLDLDETEFLEDPEDSDEDDSDDSESADESDEDDWDDEDDSVDPDSDGADTDGKSDEPDETDSDESDDSSDKHAGNESDEEYDE